MKKRKQDYRAFFVIGVSMIAVGIATKVYGLLAVGVVFMAIGLNNKGKLKKR